MPPWRGRPLALIAAAAERVRDAAARSGAIHARRGLAGRLRDGRGAGACSRSAPHGCTRFPSWRGSARRLASRFRCGAALGSHCRGSRARLGAADGGRQPDAAHGARPVLRRPAAVRRVRACGRRLSCTLALAGRRPAAQHVRAADFALPAGERAVRALRTGAGGCPRRGVPRRAAPLAAYRRGRCRDGHLERSWPARTSGALRDGGMARRGDGPGCAARPTGA